MTTEIERRIEDATEDELFELLSTATQERIRNAFIEQLDPSDVYMSVFSLIDEYDGKDRYDQRKMMARRWGDFVRPELARRLDEIRAAFVELSR